MQIGDNENDRRPGPSWGRFFGIVILYVLLGPFMGAVGVNALFTVLAVSVEIANGNYDDIARLIVGGMVVGTIISLIIAYAFGIVSAAAVGVAVAARDMRFPGISWRTALIAGLSLWLVSAIAALMVVPPEGQMQWIGGLLVAHLLAVVICTAIARLIFR